MNLFFTADSHFGHANIIKYCNRPYESTHEMNKDLINRWNSVVGDKDIIYHLGDFSMSGKAGGIIDRLKGRIYLIRGNHDSRGNIKKIKHRLEDIYDLKRITHNGVKIVLCHYAMRVWNGSHKGVIQLYGHSHGTCPPIGKQMDVGVDAVGAYGFEPYTPLSFEQIVEYMDNIEIGAEHGVMK